MRNIKGFIVIVLVITLGLSFVGCGNKEKGSSTIKVGVNGTDFTIWNYIKEELAKENIELEVISFSDYIQPNVALAEGEIDINSFQAIHCRPQLRTFINWL